MFQALALALLLDQIGDRAGHLVERHSQSAELILLVHANAMSEISPPDVLRGLV